MNTPKSAYYACLAFASNPALSWDRVSAFDNLRAGALALAGGSSTAWGDEDVCLGEGTRARNDAERQGIIDAYHAANERLIELQNELIHAVNAAPWGRQPDGTFITDSKSGAEGGRRRVLHVNRLPVAAVCNGYRVSVLTKETATKVRDAEKARTKEAQSQYNASRREVLTALRRGIRLEHRDGQEGGVIYPRVAGRAVSARGLIAALAAEGIDLKFEGGLAFVPDYHDAY